MTSQVDNLFVPWFFQNENLHCFGGSTSRNNNLLSLHWPLRAKPFAYIASNFPNHLQGLPSFICCPILWVPWVPYGLGCLSGPILSTCLLQCVVLNLFLLSHGQPYSMGRTQTCPPLFWNMTLFSWKPLRRLRFPFWVISMGSQVKVCTLFLILYHEPKFKSSFLHLKNGNNISLWVVIKITISCKCSTFH